MRPFHSPLLLAAAIAVSCGGNVPGALAPKSGGRAYEVLLASPDSACRAIVDSVLGQDAGSLPQREPCFDVLELGGDLDQVTRMARTIVTVDCDSLSFTRTRIRYEKDAWAHPQMVVRVGTPSAGALRADMERLGPRLLDLLTRWEMNVEIAGLEATCNKKASEMVADMFSWDMRIPVDMASSKAGKDFLWFSTNAKGPMRNICVYSYAGDALDGERAMAMRDSVMGANIPGEAPGMRMCTAADGASTKMQREGNATVMVQRGLWEMRGDAMGGPFVSHSVVDSSRRRVVVAEAFAYSPGTMKRNLLRKDEAALYTLRKRE